MTILQGAVSAAAEPICPQLITSMMLRLPDPVVQIFGVHPDQLPLTPAALEARNDSIDRQTLGPTLYRVHKGLTPFEKEALRRWYRNLFQKTKGAGLTESGLAAALGSWENAFRVIHLSPDAILIKIPAKQNERRLTPESVLANGLRRLSTYTSIFAYRKSGLVADTSEASEKLTHGRFDMANVEVAMDYYLGFSLSQFVEILKRMNLWRRQFSYSRAHLSSQTRVLDREVLGAYFPEFGVSVFQRFLAVPGSGEVQLTPQDYELKRAFHLEETDPLGIGAERRSSGLSLKKFIAHVANDLPLDLPIRALALTMRHRLHYRRTLGFSDLREFPIPSWNIPVAYELVSSKSTLARALTKD